MDRRTFLAGAGASLALPAAGCIDSPGGSEAADPGSLNGDDSLDSSDNGDGIWQSRDDLDRPPEDPPVVDFETAPLTATVSGRGLSTDDRFSVAVWFERTATESAPATLTGVVVNRKSFEQTIRPRRLILLQDPLAMRDGHRNSSYLVPAEDHPLAESVPEYSRDEEGRWRLDDVRDDWYPESITAPPESGFAANYYLLGHHDRSEPAIGAGRYERNWQSSSLSVTLWHTDEPGPEDPSRFVDEAVPALQTEDNMRWFHDAHQETSVYLQPDPEEIDLPGAVSVDLVNHSRESLGGNPYYWRLYKLVDDRWFPVAPWGWNQPYNEVAPGQRDEQRLVLFHGESIRIQGDRTVGHLGGGRYAYETGYSADDETYAAMFDVDAPALEVGAESGAQVVESGERVVVELPNYEDARRPATLTVDRVDAESPAEREADAESAAGRLIPEQLPRRPQRGLRNALTQFEAGVDQVVVRTDRGTALGPLGYEEGESAQVEYEGVIYEFTGELDEE